MTLKKRGKVYHCDIEAPDAPGGRIRQSLKTKDYAIAKERYDAIQRRALSGEFGVLLADAGDSGMTLADAFKAEWQLRKEWFDAKAPESIQQNYGVLVRHLGEQRRLSSITDIVVADLVVTLRRGGKAANNTVNSKLCILRILLAHGLKYRAIKHAPAIPHYSHEGGRIRFYTPAEELALFTALRSDPVPSGADVADFCAVLVDTGMRLGEGQRTEARDINTEQWTWTSWVNKAGEPRTVPLTTRCRRIIAARLVGKRPDDILFPTLTKKVVEQRWDIARAAVGLLEDEQAVIHTLRHTCASRLVQGGMDIRRVQIWMGHLSIQTTLKYAHMAKEHLLEGLAVLEKTAPAECAVAVPLQSEIAVPRLSLVRGTSDRSTGLENRRPCEGFVSSNLTASASESTSYPSDGNEGSDD